MGAPANIAYKITDAYGNRLDHVQLMYEGAFSDKGKIVSRAVFLKLAGPEAFGTLWGEAHGCSIGAQQISDDQVTLQLNNEKEIPVSLARHGFNLLLTIANPRHLDGAVQCGGASVFLSSGREQILFVSMSGVVSQAPKWTNKEGAPITHLVFNFDGKVAAEKKNMQIDSSSSQAKLLAAPGYPATIAVMRPAGCKIGNVPIRDADVSFLHNGAEISTNRNISITSHDLQTYAIRFTAGGGYGNASGAVICSNDGSLTYTY